LIATGKALSLVNSRVIFVSSLLFLIWWPAANAQNATTPEKAGSPYYARRNAWGIFAAYSGDSNHMLLGSAEKRRLLDFGISYNRRLLTNHIVNWQYSGELLPVALESDPLSQVVENQTAPTVATYTYYQGPIVFCAPVTQPYTELLGNGTLFSSGTYTVSCSNRRWTIGEGISPIGFQWNFLPQHKLQPFLTGHGGYMYSTQPIPIPTAGSFNFTFDLGVGFEFYRSKSRSVRAEFRYHHISNDDTAPQNPGIDNSLFQITYVFGK